MVSPFRLVRTNWNERTTSKRAPPFSVGIPEKLPYHLLSIRNFRNFLPNRKYVRSEGQPRGTGDDFPIRLPLGNSR